MLVLCDQDGTKETNDGANISSKEDEREEEQEDGIGQQDDNWATLLTCLWCSWDFDEGRCGSGREWHGLFHQESVLVDRPIGGRDGGGGGVRSVRAFRWLAGFLLSPLHDVHDPSSAQGRADQRGHQTTPPRMPGLRSQRERTKMASWLFSLA